MYCIIYRFEIKDGQEDHFIDSWKDVNLAFIDQCGALEVSELTEKPGQK